MVRNIFFLVIGLLATAYILIKIGRKSLSERESFYWLIGGLIILVLSIFPEGLDRLSLLLGVKYPPALLFLLSISLLFFLTFRQEEQLTLQNEKIKKLIQANALLEEKIRALRQQKD